MRTLLAGSVLALILFGCGGGGGGGSDGETVATETVTSPAVSIVGQYNLVKDYSCELLSPICTDSPNFSGTWSIGPTQTNRLKDGGFVSGTWYIEASVFYIVFDNQTGRMVIPFEFQGNKIITKSTFLNTTHYSEWLKVSNSPGELVDNGAPTVVYTSPVRGTSQIPLTATLTATFNEAIEPSTVTVKSFLLADLFGSPIGGTVTCDNRTATFMPWPPLLTDIQYTATLTTDIQDLAGNALAEAYTWSFYTPSTATLPPPTNIIAIAGNGSVDLSWDVVDVAGYYYVYGATTQGVTQNNYLSLPGGFIQNAPEASITITGLINGTTYYFVVTSFRPDIPDHIESTESVEVSATPHL